jgi:hypothetical protein
MSRLSGLARMSRISRLSIIFAGSALAALAGPVACERVPLLAPTGTVINLTVASDVAPLNSSVDVIAVLIENGGTSGTGTGTATSTTGAGTPVQNGTVVSFTTNIGTIEPAEAKTQNGRVNVKLITGGQSGKATIIAYSGGAKSTTQVTIGAAAVDHIIVTASPANLVSSGGSTTISARAEDASGNGLAGVQVQFTTTKGTLNPATATTNSNGVATTSLSTTAAADVTAAVGSKTAKVTVGVATKASISISGPTSTISVSAPAAFSVNVGTTVPVTNVTVNYGDGTSVNLGQISGTQTVQHFYARDDIFTASVTATDPDGVTATAQTQVAVVRISASVSVPAPTAPSRTVTGTVTLGSSSTNSSIDHYEWDFGDGTTVTSFGTTQTHTYSSPGTPFTVTVRVVPSYGSAFTISTQVSVS